MNIRDIIGHFEVKLGALRKEEAVSYRIKHYEAWLKLLKQPMCDTTAQYKILTPVDLVDYPKSLQHKIMNILNHGNIDYDVDEVSIQLPPNVAMVDDTSSIKLIDIHGFGVVKSKKFESRGITGQMLIDDWCGYVDSQGPIIMYSKIDESHQVASKILRDRLVAHSKYLHLLTYDQLVGVKHYANIIKKIPRVEIGVLERTLKRVIGRMNKDFVVTICGSYRRGRIESGDIDCLITHASITTMDNGDILGKIIYVLERVNFLVDHLTENGRTKYMGMCKVNESGIPRRIDIRVIPYVSYAYALLYFTGSKVNNLEMRNKAIGMGYKLNEYGMEDIHSHKLVTCETEQGIFDFLEIPYREPTERDL